MCIRDSTFGEQYQFARWISLFIEEVMSKVFLELIEFWVVIFFLPICIELDVYKRQGIEKKPLRIIRCIGW